MAFGSFSVIVQRRDCARRFKMTAGKPQSFSKVLICTVPLLLGAQSHALARAAGFQHDEPWSAERIDLLPAEVRNSVRHMCRVQPTAAQYFATYLDNARIVKLHFERFNCGGQQAYREAERCLHEEFVLSGAHYRLFKAYYARCDD